MTQTGKRRGTLTKTTPELRRQICDDHILHNKSVKNICQKYRMADRTVRDILTRFDANGTVIYKRRGGMKKASLATFHETYLKKIVDEEDVENIYSLADLREKVCEQFPEDFPTTKSLSLTAINKCMNEKLSLTFQRNALPLEENQEIETLDQLREEYCEHLSADGIDYMQDCVFVGEASFTAYMVPGKSRTTKGKTSVVLSKVKKARKISILGAMSSKKIESLQVVTVDKITDKCISTEYIESLLDILDTEFGRPMTVIMDESKFSPSDDMKDLFEQSNHTFRFLPPHSPNFNPVDYMFNELKDYIRRNPKEGKDSMVDLVKEAEKTVTAEKCTEWVENSMDNLNRYFEAQED